MIMNRFIELQKHTKDTLDNLLTPLGSCERDKIVTHFYQSRKDYRLFSAIADKSSKQIERCFISIFQVAQNLASSASFADSLQ
jgi:hypothetical protein